jgi:DNA repair exonuclease SbcCD ATPase subunit
MSDKDIVDKVGAVLCNTLMALKMSLAGMEDESTERYDGDKFVTTSDIDNLSVSSVGGVDPQELHRQVDAIIRHDREAAARDLRCELEEKSSAIQKLDELLRQERDEVARLKMQNASLKAKQEDKAKHCTEIVSLKDQCFTNMEVLTKKEREHIVFRDSLVISDVAGYISDESDDDDEGTSQHHSSKPHSHGATGSEAYTSARSRDGSETDVDGGEFQRIQFELMKAQREKERADKELQSEKESLANAKMIISSLEKANKSMLEDLRSRLHDSNTAIESLLDKSTENEKTMASLKLELERLKKEKEKAKADYSEMTRKLKDDSLSAAMREAAKEREIAQLRLAVAAASASPSPQR